jgi:DNA-binding MarR family transcriptional regulator
MTKNQDLHDRIARVVGQLIWLGSKRSHQQLSYHGLTAPQYYTLIALSHQDRPRSMHIVAGITHQDAATVTGIVDRLVKLGYVSRQRGQDDRRKVYVALEEAGRQAIEEIRKANLENWRHSFSALSQDDLAEMLRMLETILESWRSQPEPTEINEPAQRVNQPTQP